MVPCGERSACGTVDVDLVKSPQRLGRTSDVEEELANPKVRGPSKEYPRLAGSYVQVLYI